MSPPLQCGDVVWARQVGYPWWPAVLAPCPEEDKAVRDPHVGEWKGVEAGGTHLLHCIFLAWGDRAWLPERECRTFNLEDGGEGRKKEYKVKNKKYKESHLEAVELALEMKSKSKEVVSSKVLEEKIHKLSKEEVKKILKRKILVSKDAIKLKRTEVEERDESADTNMRDLGRFAVDDDNCGDSSDSDEGRDKTTVKSSEIQIITPPNDNSTEEDSDEEPSKVVKPSLNSPCMKRKKADDEASASTASGDDAMCPETLKAKVDMSVEFDGSCCGPTVPSPQYKVMPPYTMSRELLDQLGEHVLFDSHCHMDFTILWKTQWCKSFDKFVKAYPLMEHRSLEGFITNFCKPQIWREHMISPSPFLKSLLAHPMTYYTIGCHPHFTADLLSPRHFEQFKNLVKKAGKNCVAIGECGLDTSRKNGIKMSEQIRIFKNQVSFAMRIRKPLVLHIRGAEKEALLALEEVSLPADWPIHRFL